MITINKHVFCFYTKFWAHLQICKAMFKLIYTSVHTWLLVSEHNGFLLPGQWMISKNNCLLSITIFLHTSWQYRKKWLIEQHSFHVLFLSFRRTKYSRLFYVYWTVHHCDSWRIKDQLDVTCYFISLLMCSTCFGHYYIHHRELVTILLNSVMLQAEAQLVLQPATWIPLQPNHTESPTHIEPRTIRPMW